MKIKSLLTPAFLLGLCLLIGVELVVRIFFQDNMSGRFEYGFHPSAGFVEEEGLVNLKRTGGRRFRPQSFPVNPAEGVFRVFVVGDSVTRGSSVESSYTGQMAEILEANGIPSECINLGIGGHGARRKYLTLVHSLNYKPDLVVLHINNSNEFEDEREYKRSREFATWHPRNWPMKSRALRRVYEMKTEKVFWKWIPASIRVKHAKNDADAEMIATSAAGALGRWNQLVDKITSESTQTALEKQIPILLITQAYNMENFENGRSLEDKGLDNIAKKQLQTLEYIVEKKSTLCDKNSL